MDQDNLITELLHQIRSDIQDLRNEIKDVKENQIQHGVDIKLNKDGLIDHIQQTKLIENRIDILEQREIGSKYLWKVVINIGKVLGVISLSTSMIYTIIKFLK